MSYQFRRALGETQEGGGAVSECFLAASRMIPGDKESWHREWKRIADFNQQRGDAELAKGHVQTAMNCWLRVSLTSILSWHSITRTAASTLPSPSVRQDAATFSLAAMPPSPPLGKG